MQGDGHDADQAMGDEDAQGSEVGPDDEHYSSYVPNGAHDSADHPLVNGDGYANAPSGSQEQEGGAVPAAPPAQADTNQNSQDTVSSTPPLPVSNGSVPPPDAPPAAASADAPSQNTGPNGDAAQSAPSAPRPTPLQAMDSFASTVPDTNQEQAQTSPYASTVIEGGDGAEQHDFESTQPAYDENAYGAENPPGFGTSPTVTNLLGEKIPSANRLSVSYAGATRRLVIDAEVVSKLKVYRAEGRIEVSITLMADERGGFKGIAVSITPT